MYLTGSHTYRSQEEVELLLAKFVRSGFTVWMQTSVKWKYGGRSLLVWCVESVRVSASQGRLPDGHLFVTSSRNHNPIWVI